MFVQQRADTGQLQKRHIVVAIAILVWLLVLGVLGWRVNRLRVQAAAGQFDTDDFVEYWAAGRVFAQGGNPYDAGALLPLERRAGWAKPNALMMWNPPWVLALVTPFALLPYWLGHELWFWVHLIVLVATADWIWRTRGGAASRRWIGWLVPLLFFPAFLALTLGQISPLLLAGLAGFVWSVQRRRYLLAGSFASLIAIKPQVLYLFWIFLLLWVWQERRWQILAGGAIAFLISSVLVSLINPAVYAHYWTAVTTSSGPLIWETPTWGEALRKLVPGHQVWLEFVPTVMGGLAGLWLWQRWGEGFAWQDHLNSILLLSAVTTSFGWTFDMVILLPVAISILIWFAAAPARNWWWLCGLIIIQVVLVAQLRAEVSYFVTLWMPATLALLYWIASRIQDTETHLGASAL